MMERVDRLLSGVIANLPLGLKPGEIRGQLQHAALPHLMTQFTGLTGFTPVGSRSLPCTGLRDRVLLGVVPSLLCSSINYDDFIQRMALAEGMRMASPGTLVNYQAMAVTSNIATPRPQATKAASGVISVAAPRPPDPLLSRQGPAGEEQISKEMQKSVHPGDGLAAAGSYSEGAVMPVPIVEEQEEVNAGVRAEPTSEIDRAENVGQLTATESMEMVACEDVSIRNLVREESPILDVNGDGGPSKELRRLVPWSKGLSKRLRHRNLSTQRFSSPINIGPQGLSNGLQSWRNRQTGRGLLKAYPVMIGTDDKVVDLIRQRFRSRGGVLSGVRASWPKHVGLLPTGTVYRNSCGASGAPSTNPGRQCCKCCERVVERVLGT